MNEHCLNPFGNLLYVYVLQSIVICNQIVETRKFLANGIMVDEM